MEKILPFNSSRSALVKSPMFLSSNWMHLTLVLSPLSHFWRIYHISMRLCLSHSADHAHISGPLRTPTGGVIWLIFPYSDNFLLPLPCYVQKKTSTKASCKGGFPGQDIDCRCQFQYDKCQRYEDRHDPRWAGWPFLNVTCHQSFMSPSKQYVKCIKNHYTQELCYTGQK